MARIVIITLGALLAGGSANAAMFNFSYSGAGVAASGTLTTTDTATIIKGQQAFTITGVTGTRNGDVIDQLFPAATVVDFNGDRTDNYLFTTGPFLTFNGFGFGVAGDSPNTLYNPYFDGSSYVEFVSNPPSGVAVNPLDSFSLTRATAAVPEPATWAMFLGGFGLLGATMRRRQRVSVTFA